MPDILIRMEMPTMEQAYKTLIISYDGKVYEGVHPRPTAKKKEPIAEAVELPPHGDLISRDNVIEIIERLRNKSGNDEMAFALNWALRLIREKPVIVPADKEEHNG